MVWSEDDPYLLPPMELAKIEHTAPHPWCVDGVDARGKGVAGLVATIRAKAAGRHGGRWLCVT